jgi:PAS domain S-box-containing protein
VNVLSAINSGSEEKYRRLFEETTDAIIMADLASGIILECNQAAAELVERAKGDLIGQHESILFSPEETGKGLVKLFNDSQRVGAQIETKILTKNGKTKDVSINANAMDIGGKTIVYGSIRDITRQKQAEASLRYSQEQFGILAETWPNMIVIVQDGKVVYLNQETVRATGYSKEEFYASDFNFAKVISPEFRDKIAEKYDLKLKGLDLEPFEMSLIAKNGEAVEAIWSTRPINFNGKLGLVGVATDITERKKIEKQIATQKKQLESIFASSPDSITVTDMAGNILDCNQAASTMIGLKTKEAAIGKNIRELISPKNVEKAYKDLAQVMETGVPVKNLELVFLTQDGKEFPVECSGAVIKDSSGKPTSFVTITHDISERKAMQEKLQQERDVLIAVTRSINAGFVMVSRDYKIVWANEFTKNLFGSVEGQLSYQALQGNNPINMRPDNSIKKVFEENANEASHEIQITDANGEKFWLKIAAAPIKNAEGEVIAAAELAVNITDIKRAEEQIQLLSNVVEQEVDGIAVSDNQGKILFLNKSWVAMHEISDESEKLTGEPIIRFYDPEQLRAIGSITDSEGVFRGRLKQISKDGTSFTTLATLSPLRDRNGQIIGTIHTAKKLTEIVREIRDIGSQASKAKTKEEA